MKCIHFVKKTKDVFYFLQIYFVNILTYVYTNSSTLRTILNVLANIIFQLLSYGIVYVRRSKRTKEALFSSNLCCSHTYVYIRIYNITKNIFNKRNYSFNSSHTYVRNCMGTYTVRENPRSTIFAVYPRIYDLRTYVYILSLV